MKKILLVMLALSGITFNSFAQKSSLNKFSMGIDAGFPKGASHNPPVLLGFSLKYDGAIARATALTVSGGYSQYSYFIPNSSNQTISYIPIKTGIKYVFPWGLYGEGQIGVNFKLQYGGDTAFIYAPGIGYNFSDHADFGVRYENWRFTGAAIDQLILRLAYSF